MSETDLPKLWVSTTIGNIADVIMGQSPPGETYNTKGTGLPFFQGKAEFGIESPIVAKWCSSPTRIAEEGDILLSVRAPVGPTNLANQRCGIGRGLSSIRAISDLADPIYLFYYFRFIEPELVSLGSGSTFSAINRKDIETFRIPLPPLPEQRRIAAILRQADALRQWRRDSILRIKKVHANLFKWHFGTGQSSDKDTVKLEKLLQIGLSSGYSPNTNDNPNGIPVFNLSALTDYGLDEQQLKYFPENSYSGKGSDLQKDDLLISRSNTLKFVGRVGRYKGLPEKIIYPDTMIRIRVGNHIDAIYLEHFLRSPYMRAIITQQARGTSGSMKKISQADINDFQILMPSRLERETFAQKIELLDEQEKNYHTSYEKLDLLFQSITARAFTGELTASWREGREDELKRAAAERDKKLGLRGEVATWGDLEEGRLTPEEEEQFRKMALLVAKEMASLQPIAGNVLGKLTVQPDFSAFANLASRMVDQAKVIQNIQDIVSSISQTMQVSLAQMAPRLNTTISLGQALERSAETYRSVLAGSLANIAVRIVEKARRQKDLEDLELTDKQKDIFELIQKSQGYFSAESISQEYEIIQQDVLDALELFQAIGLVVKVAILDEANSTETFPIFAPAYRIIRASDDSRDDDLNILEASLNESNV